MRASGCLEPYHTHTPVPHSLTPRSLLESFGLQFFCCLHLITHTTKGLELLVQDS